MAAGLQAGVPDDLKKRLALAVRSIQWSYAIFWSISGEQPGTLEWSDGYYNGDIKTRKTIQVMELDSGQMGLHRSEQLRELYLSLASESVLQARRPSAALSPEDLTDTEWYYLVCMSFTFRIGQGLPGRTIDTGLPIWLSNAHFADSSIFCRSLLAKSASIQTVVCFPFLGGVVEIGVTELVLEDPSLIQHIRISFLGVPYPITSNTASSAGVNQNHDTEIACAANEYEILDGNLISVVGCEELEMASQSRSSNGLEFSQPGEDSFMVEGVNGGASQAQCWQFTDDEFCNCVHYSVNSSDCISQTVVEPEEVVPITIGELNNCYPPDQECNGTRLALLNLENDDLRYESVLSTLLKGSHPLMLGQFSTNFYKKSSFVGWEKGAVNLQKSRPGKPQELLKKILFEVPWMHAGNLLEIPEGNAVRKRIADEIRTSLFEKSGTDELNERFSILRSLVPSFLKDDEVSILDNAIGYVKELERRIEELESCRELTESEARTKRRSLDSVEWTSDNYCNNMLSNGKKPLIIKRKARDTSPGMNEFYDERADVDVNVCVNNKDVLIQMRCSSREGILLEIIEIVSNLHLDSYSVQSSTSDGILFLTIKSKFRGSSIASVGMIRQALQRITRIC